MEFDTRTIFVGFLGAVAVLAALLWVVGIGETRRVLGLLSPAVLAVILLVGVVWLVAWGLALRRVLGALGVTASAADGFLLYAAAAFANNVTPFGQAGGEPFSALLISRATDSEYETGLAAIASLDTLNFVPSILLALVGLSYYAARFTVGDSVRLVLGVVVLLAVGIPALAYVGWRNRHAVEARIVRLVHPVWSALGRRLPVLGVPNRESVSRRIDGFFRAIERVATSRRDLAVALTYSTLGWLCMCLALALSLRALTPMTDVGAAVVFVVVPVASIASITPLPGGTGGVEAAIVLLLVPITGISAATATSAALVFRGATYWFPILLGGGATAWLEARTGR
ncbi:TIGR00374 family protein [Halarchaeum grantii]|uniref:TIGR00374 family protein n=1 Tax=Halarchaeum grantii TaxID=1193105 RepID=A0A830ET60_9EURY|nr:lysylphosphatidylglycerol synthase transmembrane domain-containing protein [Halarchaeum grantii]GGL27871.1 TIGR00374 family protein [Halarchaeum grantii]